MKKLVVLQQRIVSNYEKLKEQANGCIIIGVVKGNGYGLGLIPFAQTLISCGVKILAVSHLAEAEALRQAGIDGEILLLSPTCLADEARRIVRGKFTATIGSAESAIVLNTAASECNSRIKAHIKIDTGFGRFGFLPQEHERIISTIRGLSHVDITGCFSHFSSSSAFCLSLRAMVIRGVSSSVSVRSTLRPRESS